jgi:hypothetical protein
MSQDAYQHSLSHPVLSCHPSSISPPCDGFRIPHPTFVVFAPPHPILVLTPGLTSMLAEVVVSSRAWITLICLFL